ncbi:MAG: hypothetical protein HGA75_01910 [Thiobacillus sp.]|nr:hypothetical protein [Thiobacillus sp.]
MMGPGEISLGLNVFDRLRKLWGWYQAKRKQPSESVATRFIQLFEAHGVHRNQIPRFFGHDLQLKDVQDDAALIARFDESILDAACRIFAVRREWLDGADAQVHPDHDFYKYPKEFAVFLADLKAANPDGNLQGVLLAPHDPDVNAWALLVLQETIGFVGDKPIYRYHLCNNWGFDYWKARAYLTACVAIAWRNRVYVHGNYLPQEVINQFAEGDRLLCREGEEAWHGVKGRRRWDPEDMALRPVAFLDGVDPEQDDFGIRSGLKLWLELQPQYMDTGLDMYDQGTIRALFQQELEKYTQHP